ncbi:amino acid adenylation domain-containing protein, partial [Streptomyces albipurpureus]
QLTYQELNARANQLARYLIGQGAGPEGLVGLALPRSAELIVTLLAVLKSGAGYVPIDPDYPADRIASMLDDAQPALLITDTQTAPAVPEAGSIRQVLLDDADTARHITSLDNTDVTDTDRSGALLPQHPAYVIYTSGSTGKPKGVTITHEGLVNRLLWMQAEYCLTREDRVLQKTPSSFDVSVWEFFWPLIVGASLVVAVPGAHRDPEELVALINRAKVTTAHFVPSMLQGFIQQAGAESCITLRRVICSGEALSAELQNAVLERLPARVYNLYGPTEATVDVTYWECRAGDFSVPIGGPVWNTRVYVLDAGLCPVAVGVQGELYIAGAQLARGYLGRPDLTAERFIANPFGGLGGRMYRTGDVVRWRADGVLEFVGRADAQVKVRGFRIEPGEIETVLATHPSVGQAAVLVREDRPGDKRLVAYVVPAQLSTDSVSVVDADTSLVTGFGSDSDSGVVSVVDVSVLRGVVVERLPDYMVPSAFVVLDALPLTPNGKLDRQALPVPEVAVKVSGRGPRSAREEVLCSLFAEVLGVAEVGIDDGFFDLGGDSIVSIQLVARARAVGLVIAPRDVFERKTVEGLALVAGVVGEALPVVGDGVGVVPLTPIMHQLREQGGPVDGFSQGVLLRVPPGLGVEALTVAVRSVLDHHDVLRARLDIVGDWSLVVPAVGAVDAGWCVRRVAAEGLDGAGLAELVRLEGEAARARLAPREGVMLQVVWFDAGPSEAGRLLVVAHHLVVDGVSWRILLPDLQTAWEAAAANRQAQLQPCGTSFRHWSLQLSSEADMRLPELPLWQGILEGSDPLLGKRALDPARDTWATAKHLSLTLSAAETKPLVFEIPTLLRCGVEDVLLTALLLSVGKWRPQGENSAVPDLFVELERHGRDGDLSGDGVSRTVGWFTSTFPVRLVAPAEEETLREAALQAALKSTKEKLRSVPDNGLGYGLLRHLSSEGSQKLAGKPDPQVLFNYLGRVPVGGKMTAQREWTLSLEGQIGASADPEMPISHSIIVNAVTQDKRNGTELTINWSWPDEVFDEGRVSELSGTFRYFLSALAQSAKSPAAGGLTPSDVGLLNLSQDEIDEFELDELED